LNQKHVHGHHFNQLWFLRPFKFLVDHVFYLVENFHQSHLNQIHDWQELNRLHFHFHHFDQLWFYRMLHSWIGMFFIMSRSLFNSCSVEKGINLNQRLGHKDEHPIESSARWISQRNW
jgi:hypothetical protein